MSLDLLSQKSCPSFFSWYGTPCRLTSSMKSHGVYRASADLQKCGFGFCEKKFAGSVHMFVKLQRPPPDMRIFLPGLFELSTSSTRRPREAAVSAHIRPAAPAPMITTSVERTAVVKPRPRPTGPRARARPRRASPEIGRAHV